MEDYNTKTKVFQIKTKEEDHEEFLYSLENEGIINNCELQLRRRKAGLSTAHIRRKHYKTRPQIEKLLAQELMNRVQISEKKGYLEIYKGGSYVKVRMPKIKYKGRNNGGGVRGEIKGFSRNSRKRMMDKIAMFERCRKPLFLTLTYPDQYNENRLDGNKLKEEDLKNFWKRLLYHYPHISCLWKIEYIDRKSGKHEGKLFPHFHLMIWNLKGDLEELREFVAVNWWEVVGELSEDHRKAGTSLERVKSIRGVFYYVAKYMGKSQSHNLTIGRWWGVKNKTNLPYARVERFEFFTEEMLEKLMMIVKYKLGVTGDGWLSLSCYMDTQILWENLDPILFDT